MVRCRISLLAVGAVALFAPSAAAGAEGEDEPAPDLFVTKVSKPPASAVAGSKITVVVNLRNKGTAVAGKSRVGLYLAKGKKRKVEDPRLRRAKVRALEPGKKAKAKLKVTLPATTAAGSYRLIACADDTKKVRELKEGNCTTTKRFALALRPIAVPPPTPAFAMADGVDWGIVADSASNEIEAGTPIATTLRAGNGIPGAAGYARSSLDPQPLLPGTTTTMVFGNNKDDSQVTLPLPFAFPFGGLEETSISVSTNGWVSFGSPAWDYWNNSQLRDYRDETLIVSELERGIMPYWADLDARPNGAGLGTVKEVIAPDDSYVAFQWDVSQSGGGPPQRTFQLVLFPDGRFRMDYPGSNQNGGRIAFVGYSLGTGPGSADVVANSVQAVPGRSILITPNPVAAGAPLPAGEATMTLPAGSSVISMDPGCAVALAPSPLSDGRVSCQMPSLASGQQSARAITFATPPDAPGQNEPAQFRLRSTYAAGGSTLTDGDEINPLESRMEATTNSVEVQYEGPNPPKANAPAEFTVSVEAQGANAGLDEPTVALRLPASTTLSSILIAGRAIPCGPLEGASITCKLPSGMHDGVATVRVVPSAAAIGSKLTLEATARALNAPSKGAAGQTAGEVAP